MKINLMKNLATNQNTPFQPSTIPSFRGGFEKMQKSAGLLKNRVSIRKIKGFIGDGRSCAEKFGEGGQLNHRTFFSGFN
ncbi:MAG: hypothetical protein WC451_06525 [Patescibacteria group bacterium]|jgi:hypothetical protein